MWVQTRPYSGLAAPHCRGLPLHHASRPVAAAAAAAAARAGSRGGGAAACSLRPPADAEQRGSGQCSTSFSTSSSSNTRGAAARPLPGAAIRHSWWHRSSPAAAARRGGLLARSARRGGGGDGGAPTALQPPDPKTLYLVEAGFDEDGNPIYEPLGSEWVEAPEPVMDTEELLAGLDGVDLGGGSDDLAARLEDAEAEVPAVRTVRDPEELELIGDGLPIIHGVRWQ
jgi:hypothetical protein